MTLFLIFVLLSGGKYISDSFSAPDSAVAANSTRWVSFGAGANFSDPQDDLWLAGGLQFTKRFENMGVSIRWLGSVESEQLVDGPDPRQYVKDLGLLVGKVYRSGPIRLSVAAGVAYVYGMERGAWLGTPGQESYKHEKSPIHTVGAPVDLQITLLNKKSALGFTIFANANTRRSFAGVMVCYQLGN